MKKWLVISILFVTLCVSAYYVSGESSTPDFSQNIKFYQNSQTVYEIDTVRNKFFKMFAMTGDPYDTPIVVMLTNDTARAINIAKYVLRDSTVNLRDFNVAGLTMYNAGKPLVLWMPQIPVQIQDVATANHELFHVTAFIMLYAGIPLNISTQEAYAYELGYLTKQFYYKAYN